MKPPLIIITQDDVDEILGLLRNLDRLCSDHPSSSPQDARLRIIIQRLYEIFQPPPTEKT